MCSWSKSITTIEADYCVYQHFAKVTVTMLQLEHVKALLPMTEALLPMIEALLPITEALLPMT